MGNPSVSPGHTLDHSTILTYLRDVASGPCTVDTLAQGLEIDDAGREALQQSLEELTTLGAVVQTRERYGVPERMNLVVGRLSGHPDGFAFVVPTGNTGQADLFVPGHQRAGALHGDRVVARIEHRRRSGRVEGSVIRVLERARQRLVGTFQRAGAFGKVQPFDIRVNEIMIPADAMGEASDGQIVQIEITDYGTASSSLAGKVLEVLGDPDDAKVDVEVVIREYGLEHEFSPESLAEAAAAPTEVSAADIEGREDFRALPIVTIDGANAQDFDDAVYVELLPSGDYRLHVHIADVAAYIAPGSALDTEARRRATSTYFPGRVLPMLPEQLSNGICSLKPGVDRLVHSLLIDIDRHGRTVNYHLHDGVIRSAKRFTYTEVAAVVDGDESARKEHAEHVAMLERMRALAQLIMEVRRERGSIDFDLPEPEILINLRGETEDIVKAERNIAHRIIEEFMIRANEVVASHLTWEDVPTLYRVHEGPNEERVESLREFISGLGHTLGGGKTPRPLHFGELLSRLDGRPEERVVSTLVLRSMKQARYQPDNQGHFGLASPRYGHFTSPIRRYPDLVVHRILKAERGSEKVAGEAVEESLVQLGADCSRLERRSEEAEREYCAWKKVQFMQDKLGETYEGHITGVRAFGMFVELEPFFVEGLISVSSMDDDYYRFDEAKHALVGERTGRRLTLGDRVKVTLAKVDMARRRLDFALQEGPLQLPPPPEQPRRSRRRRSGRRKDQRSEQPVAVASAADTSEGKRDDAARVAAAPDAAKSTGDRKPRRRRGRRGGRKRSAAREGQQSSAADKSGESNTARDKGKQRDQAATGHEAKTEPKRAARGNGERKTRSRSRDDNRGRANGRKGNARRDRDGRRGGRGQKRSDEPKPAPAPMPARADSAPKDSERPAVNPYLTEIDY